MSSKKFVACRTVIDEFLKEWNEVFRGKKIPKFQIASFRIGNTTIIASNNY